MKIKNQFIFLVMVFAVSKTVCMETPPFPQSIDDDFVAGIKTSVAYNTVVASLVTTAHAVHHPAMRNPRQLLAAMGFYGGILSIALANWAVDGGPCLHPFVYDEPAFQKPIKEDTWALGLLSGDLITWGLAGQVTLMANRLPAAKLKAPLFALHLLLSGRVAYKLHQMDINPRELWRDRLSKITRKRTQEDDDEWWDQ